MAAITEQHITQALEMLAEGETLTDVAAELDVKRTTLLAALTATKELSDRYAHARDAGIDVRAEEIESIASELVPRTAGGSLDAAAVAQLRLRVDSRKWLLSKLAAHKYGDKLEIKQESTITDLTEAQIDAKLARLLEQSGQIAVSGSAGREDEAEG
jgi:hypothetical protein